MFDSRYKLERKSKDEYRLSLPIDSDWESKDQRVLIIMEVVDSQDLLEGKLLSERSGTVLENLLKYSFTRAKLHGFNRKSCAFAAINFNNIKFMDKPKEMWPSYKAQFAKRVRRAIQELKPTHILICGDHAAESLLAEFEIDFLPKKRGWIFDLKFKDLKVKVCTTLDLNTVYMPKKKMDLDEDDDEDDFGDDTHAKSNLLFYMSDHVCNILCSKLIFSLADLKVNVVYVDTLEKFDKLYKRLKTEKVVALDTETKNGTVNHNAIHTIQFSFEKDKSYFLPYKHPESPFSAKEIRYIGKRLRKFLAAEPGVYPCKYIITQYGMFDLRVCRVEFGIPVIHHPIWEITAGEYLLDENRTQLAKSPFSTPHGGLEQIFMVYGNDYYKTSPFGKGDRANPNLTKLSNPDFIKYGGMDTQSIFGIHEKQKERASFLTVGDKPFLPYFKKLMIYQMSNTVHALSHMMQKGTAIDKGYLALLKSNSSPLLKLLDEVKKRMMDTPEVKKANKLLLKESSGQASNKGLFNRERVIFNFNKQSHKEALFFTVMGLKPVSFTKNKSPQINKTFIKAYERDIPIVESFGKYQKLSKLWSAYVKGWWDKIQESADSKLDWRLRAMYGFFNVVTGRLNSYDPSLQQVPSRGAEAKYIKRAFIAPPGTLLFKYDYSAHEVRVWSYVSGDEELASTFRKGQSLRQKLIQTVGPEAIAAVLAELKKKGDIHLINVKRFFGMWVDKEHPFRDAIKSVIFGVIYSKSAKSLAKDMQNNAVGIATDKVYALRAEVKKLEQSKDKEERKLLKVKLEALRAAEKDLLVAQKDNKQELADTTIQKLFGDFKKGAKWLRWTKKHAEENYYTYSPIGMRRNLHGIVSGIQSIVSSMLRKAANSPIQGFASQIGVTAARLIILETYKTLKKFGYIDDETTDMPVDVLKAVHDALHSETPYEIMMIYIHIVQWVATYGVTAYYKEKYGVVFPVEPEIEIEIGASEDAMYKWNWTSQNLEEILLKALEDQVKIKTLKEDPKKVLKKIYAAYDNKKLKTYLETEYPILGVRK